jgi:glycosyltransferase involved in cell wall biosynthesis
VQLFTKSILIVKHCFEPSFGGPAEDFEKFLAGKTVKTFTVISHPLNDKSFPFSTLAQYSNGELTRFIKIPRRKFGLFSRFIDLFIFSLDSKFEVVIGFNAFSTVIGYLKNRGRRAIYLTWFVDFVPSKKLSDKFYLLFESYSARICNFWIENTIEAAGARKNRTLIANKVSNLIIPIGIWKEQILSTHYLKKGYKVCYFGSIDSRNGADLLASIILQTLSINKDIEFHIIGKGPKLNMLETFFPENFLSRIKFYGAIEDINEAIIIMNDCKIGLAPYTNELHNFSQYANPGKLIRYLACGLHIITTNVTPNHKFLELETGAKVFEITASARDWANAINYLIVDDSILREKQSLSLIAARDFTNEDLFNGLLDAIS